MFRYRRRRIYRKGPLPFKYVFLLTFIGFVFLTFQSLWIINKGIEPTLMRIAETKTNQLATRAINEAVSRKLSEDLNVEKLVNIEKDNEGNISSIGWNSYVVNYTLRQTTERVQQKLSEIEKGNYGLPGVPSDIDVEMENPANAQSGIKFEIPLGQATNNALLANLGPRVPVSFTAIGSVDSNFDYKLTPYGINSMLIEIFIRIKVDMQVIIPFKTKIATVSTNIPVDIRVLPGEVPLYYHSGGKESDGASPAFQLPLKK